MATRLAFKKKAADPGTGTRAKPWKLLVVDDDTEVHSVTRLALRSMAYRGRPVDIQSAYSGAEAADLLAAQDDIAIILLDVVMETDDAGLQLVRTIREELNNRFVRIILRTGQPGQAPEEKVIVEYDINDYKAKTELTAQKLFTATLTALRAYDDIMAIELHRRGLRQIIDASDSLFKKYSLRQFAEGVLVQLSAFLGIGANGILCVQGSAHDAVSERISVLAATPEYGVEQETPLTAVPLKDDVAQAILDTFRQRRSGAGADFTTFYLGDGGDRDVVAYLHCPPPEDDLSASLVQLFCTKISVGFENLYLYERIGAMNAELEAKVEERTRELEDANRALERLAATDPLTGAANRRKFMELAEREVERARRTGNPLALAMLDLDHFKAVNDTYGHQAGDTVLKETVARVGGVLRAVDVLGRFGGEEFAILLPETDAEGAGLVAERLREAIQGQPVPADGTDIAVTTSIGVAILCDEGLDHLIGRGDDALYAAKEAGRNRVVVG